ncbi:MAG: isochorismate synthase [Cellulomonadaceae bacterium]
MNSTPAGTGRLVARTVRLDLSEHDVHALWDLLDPRAPLSWVRRGEGIVGWGEVARVTTTGADRMADAERAWHALVRHADVRDDVRLPGTGPVAFGTFAFDDASAADSVLVVPETVVGRRGADAWMTTLSLDPDAQAAAPTLRRTPVPAPGAVTFTPGSLDAREWCDAVGQAVAGIRAGMVDKVVLARDVLARTQHPIDPRWPLRRLAEEYAGCWTFSVDGMIGATPELLVRSERGLVISRVLAGTVRRTGDDDADLAHAAHLTRSSKDLEEHEYAVASVAQALEPFCSSTNVPDAPFVLHLPNVMHLATDVTGVLQEPVSSLALAAALHPTAAVCGTPTTAARELIRRLEGLDRGRYAGPVGWLGADGDGEWGLALRSAQLDPADPHRARLFAGCGIVAASDPASELAETEAKLEPMQHALGSA